MTEEKKVVFAVSAAMFVMLAATIGVLHLRDSNLTGFAVNGGSLVMPSINYSSFLFIGLLLFIILAASSISVSREKKKFSGQLGELVKNIKKSLIAGDLGGAINGYKVLTEQFSNYQDRIPRKDLGLIYKESLDLYAEIVRLQARSRREKVPHSRHAPHGHKSI